MSTKTRFSRANSSTRRRRRLRKNIREAIQICLIGAIGSVALAALFFGAVVQEASKLETMAVAEVAE